MIVSPVCGAALSTVFWTATSAAGVPFTDALPVLLPRFGSCSVADPVAMFVRGPVPSTVAVIVSVDDTPLASEPTFQTPAA